MNHSKSCQQLKKAEEDYNKQWPKHCKECHGAGETTWTENQSPLGSGHYWPETMSEFCGDCTGIGLCPRCGKPFPPIMELEDLYDDDSWRKRKHCPSCNWCFDDGGAPIWECYCWENEE